MPRNRRWLLALFVLVCVIVAPLQAPYYGAADESASEAVDPETSLAFGNDTDDSIWDGFLYPGNDVLEAGLFSRIRSAGYLPDPEEYARRAGASFGVELGLGGGEPFDYEFLFADGSRVFPLPEGSFRVSQEFGCVPLDPGYARPAFCPPDRPSFHHGVDFAADEGTVIYASATGTVNFAGIDRSNDAGNSIIRIIHDGANSGFVTEYFHWRVSFVEPGDYVIAGQPIGEVGSVGYSSGPHLHFGVFDAGASEYIDPLPWLNESASMQVALGQGGVGGSEGVMTWAPLIREASDRYGIPAALIAAIITVESSGNPEAVSPVGAQGLMQVMPMHLERYGIPASQWRDPATNIDAGTRLLSELVAQYGTLTNAVGAYFGFGCDVLGTCTEDYIAAVFSWFSHYVPLFGDVAVDAGEYLPPVSASAQPSPVPGNSLSETPTAEPEPTVSPSPEPVPSPSPEPVATPIATEEPSPTETPGEPQPGPAEPTDPTEPVDSEPVEGVDPDGDDPDEDDPSPVMPDPRLVDAFESQWAVDTDAGVVLRHRLDDGSLVAVIDVGAEPWAITASDEHVWVVSRVSQSIQRIDPETNEVETVRSLEMTPTGIAIVDGLLVVAIADQSALMVFDIETLEPAGTVEIAAEACDVWYDDTLEQLLVKECETGDITTLDPERLVDDQSS
jgi:hypothetical protein